MVRLFSATLFVGSFLLFLVQPMLGRLLLPAFGGTASVWTTCLLFYQGVLLLGYAYAHLAPGWMGVGRHAVLHLVLMVAALALLPVEVPAAFDPGSGSPIGALLGQLFRTAFLPLFVLSAGAPLLQRWFAATGHRQASDPYFLYRASNLGSLLALGAYPFLVEPLFPLSTQAWVWMGGYAVLIVMVAGCGWYLRHPAVVLDLPSPRRAERTRTVPIVERGGPALRFAWILLAAIPSSWLMGVTTKLTTDIAPAPLLWVVPLAIYLLTYVAAFARGSERWLRSAVLAVPALVVGANWLTIRQAVSSVSAEALLALAPFTCAALAFHGALARLRPEAKHLTEYYLWLAAGGWLGGVFNALVAPMMFSSLLEYPLVQLAACGLVPVVVRWLDDRAEQRVLVGYAGAAALTVVGLLWWQDQHREAEARTVYQARNFYGQVRVLASPDGQIRRMVHGNVVHGVQLTTADPRVQRTPLWYFFPTGPAGDVFTAMRRREPAEPVAIIGLGAGALAAYARPGQAFIFYELNPAVVDVAKRPALFSYLDDSAGTCETILGDARLTLRQAPEGHFGLIVIDAFNSDAIPTHLLTQEALQLYVSKLRPGGCLLFHITNDYLDLSPVLARLAVELNLASLTRHDDQVSAADHARGKRASQWVLLARTSPDLAALQLGAAWKPIVSKRDVGLWTDDYCSIWKTFK